MTAANHGVTLTAPPDALGGAATPRAPLLVDVPEDPSVRIAFTGRTAPGRSLDGANLSLVVGDGDVRAARRAALELVGARPQRAVFMAQVHGGAVARVGDDDAGRGVTRHDDAIPAVDALVTTATDLALAVMVADCVPIVLVDPGRGVGVVHAGRQGVVAGVVAAAVRLLAPENPGQVVAVVGPAIGGCCYEVPDTMVAEVAEGVRGVRSATSWGTPSLDLPAGVSEQLRSAGVGRVHSVGSCTRCHPGTWFSHRASLAAVAPPGRQAGLVIRRPAEATPDSGAPSLQSPAWP